jgi:hypothetical protein
MQTSPEASPSPVGTPISIIVTNPHSLCTDVPPCDIGSAGLAQSLELALGRTNISTLLLSADIPRAVCDLNRKKCENTTFLQTYRRQLSKLQSVGPDVLATAVIDAHSFPGDYDWGLGTVPIMGVVLRPVNRVPLGVGFDPMDNALIFRMLKWAGSGWQENTKYYRNGAWKASTVENREGQIFFAIIQGSDENYIITQAEGKGVLAVLAEINDSASFDSLERMFFGQTIVAAVMDGLYAKARRLPTGISQILYSPVRGRVTANTVTKGLRTISFEITDERLVYIPTDGLVKRVSEPLYDPVTATLFTIEMETRSGHLVTMSATSSRTPSSSEHLFLNTKTAKDFKMFVAGIEIGRAPIGSIVTIAIDTGATSSVEEAEAVIPNSVLAYWPSK